MSDPCAGPGATHYACPCQLQRLAALEAERQLSRESFGVLTRKIEGLEAELQRVTGERDNVQGLYEVAMQSRRDAIQRAEAAEAQYRQEAGEHMHTADSLSLCRANLEAAEAQVAALVDLANKALIRLTAPEWAAAFNAFQPFRQALANLPQSAARLLAAERVAETLMRHYAPSLKAPGPLIDAMEEMEKQVEAQPDQGGANG